LLKKIDLLGTVSRIKGSGRQRSVRTDENIQLVNDLILSQDDKPQTHRSQREIVRELGISRTSVRRIIKNDLGLKCLKKTRAHELTVANKASRLTRAQQLLERFPSHLVNFIVFTDEKIFTVASPNNIQNDFTPTLVQVRRIYPQSIFCERGLPLPS
jgi:DNA invertase Pin-like site-specific DNA recombinase